MTAVHAEDDSISSVDERQDRDRMELKYKSEMYVHMIGKYLWYCTSAVQWVTEVPRMVKNRK